MTPNLKHLQQLLSEAQRRSGQSSYRRVLPAAESLSSLLKARSGLADYVKDHPADVQAWRSLSQAEECLLDYAAARRNLEQSISLTPQKDKKDLKKLAAVKESEAFWTDLILSPIQFGELADHLDAKVTEHGCDHTLRHTQEWFQSNGVDRSETIIEALRKHGGYCDCEVLNNGLD
jgi:hypothetical protein